MMNVTFLSYSGDDDMKITVIGGSVPEQEQRAYADYVKSRNPDKIIEELEIHLDGDFVDLKYKYDSVPFERIRRITGYLVGTLDRFNNAKREEVQDRVKHG
jgi:hypothetical protein